MFCSKERADEVFISANVVVVYARHLVHFCGVEHLVCYAELGIVKRVPEAPSCFLWF